MANAFSIPTGLEVTFEDKDYSKELASLMRGTDRFGIDQMTLATNERARNAIAAAENGGRVDKAGLIAVMAAAPAQWWEHIKNLATRGESSNAKVRVTRDLVLPAVDEHGVRTGVDEMNLKGYEFHIEGAKPSQYQGTLAYVPNPPEKITLRKRVSDAVGDARVEVAPAAIEAAVREQNNIYHLKRLNEEINEKMKQIGVQQGVAEQYDSLGPDYAAQKEAALTQIDSLRESVADLQAQEAQTKSKIARHGRIMRAKLDAIMGDSVEARLDEYEEGLTPSAREDTGYNIEANREEYEKSSGYMIYGDQIGEARDREDQAFWREGDRVLAANFFRNASPEEQNALTALSWAVKNVQDLDLAVAACAKTESDYVSTEMDKKLSKLGPDIDVPYFIETAPARLENSVGSPEAAQAAVIKVLSDGISALPAAKEMAERAMERTRQGRRGFQSSKADKMLEQAKKDAAPRSGGVVKTEKATKVSPAKMQTL